MKAHFSALIPMLYTDSLDQSIVFYEKLGFVCGDRNAQWQWAALHRDEVEVMLARPNEHTPFNGATFTGSSYIRVSDVQAVWESLPEGINVCYEPETFEWGMREFGIFDNNGYLLQFGQDLHHQS